MGIGLPEMVMIGVIAVLLFGKRLPEVARSLGKSYQEFRSGLSEIQTSVGSVTELIDVDVDESPFPSSSSSENDENGGVDAATAPKFEPPTEESPA